MPPHLERQAGGLPAKVLHQIDRNVPAVVLPNTHLPLLGPVKVWPDMPVPQEGMMLPDFSKPAFAFVALSALHFRAVEDGGGPGPYRSDYRCQLRYTGDPVGAPDAEVRVYFVGRENVNAGEDVPALLAFLDWERQGEKCREGSAFELREGARVTATGVVQAIATRRTGS